MSRRLTVLLAVLAMLFALAPAAGAGNGNENFFADLSGSNEVPPRDTEAFGKAFVRVRHGEQLSFKLIVNDIENVFAAHIHCGPPDMNGPVGVTLYMALGSTGPENGMLAQGDITATDPPPPGADENACGWEDVSDVIAALQSGNTYVNVHTNDGEDPPNTGPGDFPGGEIRGQLG